MAILMYGSIGKAYDWEDLQSGRRLACKEGPTPGREGCSSGKGRLYILEGMVYSWKEGCSPGRECPTPGMERHTPKD